MTAIRSRIADRPHRCPLCRHVVHPEQVIAQINLGSTFVAGCLDCAWAAENGVLPGQQEAS